MVSCVGVLFNIVSVFAKIKGLRACLKIVKKKGRRDKRIRMSIRNNRKLIQLILAKVEELCKTIKSKPQKTKKDYRQRITFGDRDRVKEFHTGSSCVLITSLQAPLIFYVFSPCLS